MDGLLASAAHPRRTPSSKFTFTPAQTRLIRVTVARACSDAEFDHFIAVAERAGLDPLRRQINAMVLNAHSRDKRSMLPQVGIDGLRAIAARHGDYRPMESEPEIEFDATLRDPNFNPLGIVRAKVVVWKRFDGSWFPIAGEAWWDEYAPRVIANQDWAPFDQAANPKSRTETGLAANWRRMGRVLICKCAEAQALRRGWPEDLSGLYGEEELHRAILDDDTATERVREHEAQKSQALQVGGQALMFTFAPGTALEHVRRADLATRLGAFVKRANSKHVLDEFIETNAESLRMFWEWDSGAALAFKQEMEKKTARLQRRENNVQATPKRTNRNRVSKKTLARTQETDHSGSE